jgi:hypothetical protein
MELLEKKYSTVSKRYLNMHSDLPPVLRDGAKRQPEGVSVLVPRALAAEWARRQGKDDVGTAC